MKALVYTHYGSPDVLKIKEAPKPAPKENEVLVKIYATTVNRTDTATIQAKPFFARVFTGLFRPKAAIPGTEFSGQVEAAGKNVSTLKPGDKVFGFSEKKFGAHGEYITIPEDEGLCIMPEKLTYEQAAPSSEGAHYAYNFINKIDLKPGQKVLVNGATGAIGSAAVQLLKYFGAHVTAVCRGKDFELVKSLGAERLIDYTKEDFTKDSQKFDYVFDCVGKSSFFKCRRLLQPGGVYISSDLGFLAQNMFLPSLTPLFKPLFQNKITRFPMPEKIQTSLLLVKKLIEEKKFKAVMDRVYPFEEIIEAYRYVNQGQKTGSVVITLSTEGSKTA